MTKEQKIKFQALITLTYQSFNTPFEVFYDDLDYILKELKKIKKEK